MALISCPKCGNPVSDKATKCPHCNEVLSDMKAENCIDVKSADKAKTKKIALFATLAVLVVVTIGGMAYYIVAQEAKAKELQENEERAKMLQMRNDSLYAHFSTRSLEISEVHGCVEAIDDWQISVSEDSLSCDLPIISKIHFNEVGEIDAVYNDEKPMVTHLYSQSIVATKDKIECSGESERYLTFDHDFYRYDIFSFRINDGVKTSATYTLASCDGKRGELTKELTVRYSDYEDGKYHVVNYSDTIYEASEQDPTDHIIKTTIRYKYTKADSLGNWTERIGEVTQDIPWISELQRFKITETRKITYYEKSRIDFDKILSATNNGKEMDTNGSVYNEINKVLRLAKNQEQEQQSEDSESSGTKDIAALTYGQWHFYDEANDIDFWYSFESGGTGKLRVSYSTLNIPDISFRWTINNGNLDVRWDEDMTALAKVNGWNGEILKLTDEEMLIRDNREYSIDVYKRR